MVNVSDSILNEYASLMAEFYYMQACQVPSDSIRMRLLDARRERLRYHYIRLVQAEEQCNLATAAQRLAIYG